MTATNSADKTRLRKRKWWAKNKKHIRKLRTSPRYRYSSLQTRCKRENRVFSISYKTYVKKLTAGCYYCGADMSDEIGGGMDRRNNNNPKYTARNLVACCSDCNKVKSDRLTEQEMLVAMKAVNKYRKSLDKQRKK